MGTINSIEKRLQNVERKLNVNQPDCDKVVTSVCFIGALMEANGPETAEESTSFVIELGSNGKPADRKS